MALKNALAMSVTAVGQGGRAVFKTSYNVLGSLLTLDPVRVYTETMPPRQIWLAVRVLSDQFGPLLNEASDPEHPGTSLRQDRWTELDRAIDEARRIFRQQANVVLQPGLNSEMIDVIESTAPDYALNVGCNGRAYREGLSAAGKFFEKHARREPGGGPGGRSHVTVFIVADVQGKSGCSLGPLTDYVTVDVGGLIDRSGTLEHAPWTLAHELGHACNLWHHGDTLMRPGPQGRRDYLKRWQRALLRASSHVVGI